MISPSFHSIEIWTKIFLVVLKGLKFYFLYGIYISYHQLVAMDRCKYVEVWPKPA